jgi:hypothetical protein
MFIENATLLAIIRQGYGAREYAIVAPPWIEARASTSPVALPG